MLRMVAAYQPLLLTPVQYTNHVWNVATLLHDTGHPEEALSLREYLVDHFRQSGDKGSLQASLGNHANILKNTGRFDEAVALYKDQEQICREIGNKDGLQYSLGNQALILDAWSDHDGAMSLHKEQERICKELGNKNGLATSLANQAILLSEKMNRPREALPLAEEAYRLATDHGLNALAGQIKPILDAVRAKIG